MKHVKILLLLGVYMIRTNTFFRSVDLSINNVFAKENGNGGGNRSEGSGGGSQGGSSRGG